MFNFKQAVLKEKEWIKVLNKDDNDIIGQIKIIKNFGDGFKIVQLLDQSARSFEGSKMNHCVASYSDKDVIYSLRDELNEPHCTMELTGQLINQIKGYGNGKVSPKYVKYVLVFLKELNLKVDYYDMNNIGYYHLNSKLKVSFKKIFKDYKILTFNKKEYVYTGNQLALNKPIRKFNINIFYYLVQNDQCREAFSQLIDLKKTNSKSSGRFLTFDPIRVAAESENIYALDLLINESKLFAYSYCFDLNQKEVLFSEIFADMIELGATKSVDYFLSKDMYKKNRLDWFKQAISLGAIVPVFTVLDRYYSLNNKELNRLLITALNYQSNKDIVNWFVNKGARAKAIPECNYFLTKYSKFNDSIWVLINNNAFDKTVRSNFYVLVILGICYFDKKLIDLAIDSGFRLNQSERKGISRQFNIQNLDASKYNELLDYCLTKK